MSITATLYNIQCDSRVVDKSGYLDGAHTIKSVTMIPFDSEDVFSPSFTLDFDAGYLGANYMYVPEWGRYYFITGITPTTGGRSVLSARVDVLQTYHAEILAQNCILVRCEDYDAQNAYIHDQKAIPYQYTQTWTRDFGSLPTSFNHIYLSTVG